MATFELWRPINIGLIWNSEAILLLGMPDGEAQTYPEGKGQRWIAYGGDSLVAGEVVQLSIRGNPGHELVASAEIELGITGV
jgi:hypothetical protein